MNRRLFLGRQVAVAAGLLWPATWPGAIAAIPSSGPGSRARLSAVPVATDGTPTGRRSVNARNLGARGAGVTDDTAALQNALAHYDRVYLPPGVYLVNNLQLKTGNELFGKGPASVLKQDPAAQWAVSANPGSGGTPNTRDNMQNLYLHDLKFLGQAGQRPFNEHVHLLNLNAVSGVLVSHCTFAGYLGDGIYLGSGNNGGLERHNERVTIQDCLFDGIVRNNRNGISIIDGTDITVRRCLFIRSGNRTMPAGIDIEPNPDQDAFVRIQRIWIDQCVFSNMGSMAMICIALQPQAKVVNPAQGITISNCRAARPGSHDQAFLFVRQGENVQPDASTPPLGLVLQNCRSDGIPAAMTVQSVRGLRVSNCAFNQAAAPQMQQSLDCSFSQVTVNGKPFQPA